MRNKLTIIAAVLLIAAVALFAHTEQRHDALQQQITELNTEIALLDADTHAIRMQEETELTQLQQLEQDYAIQKERYDAVQHQYQKFHEATAQ